MIKNLVSKYRRNKKQKRVCLDVKKIFKVNIRTVLDVGANKGEFSKAALKIFKKAQVYAFEPISYLFNNYLLKIKNKRFKPFMFALANRNSIIEFNYNLGRKRKSSLLDLTDNEGFRIKKIKTGIKKFDSLNIEIKRPCFLKIDVEGAEMLVLGGFKKNLNKIDVLQLEVNFSENFKGQAKIGELIEFLEKYSFRRFIQKNINYHNKIPQSCDLIFFK